MARFSRIEVALKMKETGIVPVFYSGDAQLCKQVVKACYNGGIRVFEFTNRGDFASWSLPKSTSGRSMNAPR